MPSYTVQIQVLGDKVIERRLHELADATQKKVVTHALREGGRPVLKTAQTLCPVRTGALKKSLKLRAYKKRRQGIFGVAVFTGTRRELGIPEGYRWYYPMAVEYGHGNVPAHSFMRKALDDNRRKSMRIIKTQIGTGIEREARRIARKS